MGSVSKRFIHKGRRGHVVKAAGWLSLDRQFEPYPRANSVAPSWCGLGCRSRTSMFFWTPQMNLAEMTNAIQHDFALFQMGSLSCTVTLFIKLQLTQ